jgi:hypothetical protein
MIKGEIEGWPQRLEFDLMPVEHGRVQVLTRVPPADKDDLVRISNHTGFSQQDVMRMFLVCGMRAFLAKVRAEAERQEGITEVMTDNSQANPLSEETVATIENAVKTDLKELQEQSTEQLFDPSVPPGVRRDD